MPTIASSLRTELEKLQSQKTWVDERVTYLEDKIAELEALEDQDTTRVRRLAVELHLMLCTAGHGPGECDWNSVPNQDDPDQADWNQPAHEVWLERARAGIAKMKELGFTVEDPEVDP